MQGFIFTFSIKDDENVTRGVITLFAENLQIANNVVEKQLVDYKTYTHKQNLRYIFESKSLFCYEMLRGETSINPKDGFILTSFLV